MPILDHLGGIGRALSTPAYRNFWMSNAGYSIGRWMYRLATGWLTWQLTESPSWLGIVAFCDTFPTVIVSMAAGALADRIGYLRCLRISQIGTSSVMCVFAILMALGAVRVEMVAVFAGLIGCFDALSAPSRLSVVHSLVPREQLSSAIALGSATFNASRFVGPAIAGVLIQWLGLASVFAACTLAFLQYLIVLLFLRAEEPDRSGTPPTGMLREIGESIVYVARHKGMRYLIILLIATAVLIRPYIDLMAGVSEQIFAAGSAGQATLLSATGLGGLTSGIWLAQRGRTAGLTRHVSISLLLSALCLIAFLFSGRIEIAALFVGGVGYFILVGGIGSQTLIQNAVDSRMRGRVVSIFILTGFGLPAIGAFAMGLAASVYGFRNSLAVGGAIAILVWIWAEIAGRRAATELEQPKPQS